MLEPTQRTELKQLLAAEPDLVDRIFEYLKVEFPHLSEDAAKLKHAEQALRAEFGGDAVYVRKRGQTSKSSDVLRLFNGRNATEVARRLGVSRRTVYRLLKQAGE